MNRIKRYFKIMKKILQALSMRGRKKASIKNLILYKIFGNYCIKGLFTDVFKVTMGPISTHVLDALGNRKRIELPFSYEEKFELMASICGLGVVHDETKAEFNLEEDKLKVKVIDERSIFYLKQRV